MISPRNFVVMAVVVVIYLCLVDRISIRCRRWLIIIRDYYCIYSLNVGLAFDGFSLFLLWGGLFALGLISFVIMDLWFFDFLIYIAQYLFVDNQIYLDFLLSYYSMRVFMLNFIFLVITAALNWRFRNYKGRHFFEEWIWPE